MPKRADRNSLDTRGEDRTRRLLGAQIGYHGGVAKIDCVIRNVSPSGAQIELSDCYALPMEFDVAVPTKDLNYRARLTWRNETTLGVAFIEGSV